MKHVLLALVVSVVVAPSIIGGSIAGAMFRRPGLFLGAIAGGVILVPLGAVVGSQARRT